MSGALRPCPGTGSRMCGGTRTYKSKPEKKPVVNTTTKTTTSTDSKTTGDTTTVTTTATTVTTTTTTITTVTTTIETSSDNSGSGGGGVREETRGYQEDMARPAGMKDLTSLLTIDGVDVETFLYGERE